MTEKQIKQALHAGVGVHDSPYGEVEVELPEFITSALDGDDYERGALERAQQTARNASKAVALLILRMIEAKMLTKEMAASIIYEASR